MKISIFGAGESNSFEYKYYNTMSKSSYNIHLNVNWCTNRNIFQIWSDLILKCRLKSQQFNNARKKKKKHESSIINYSTTYNM